MQVAEAEWLHEPEGCDPEDADDTPTLKLDNDDLIDFETAVERVAQRDFA